MPNRFVTLSTDELALSQQWPSTDVNVMPAQVRAMGDLGILRRKKLALFCSVKCPGTVILQTYDCMKVLRDAGITVVGGFHSPMEKECLKILLRGAQSVIVCPARSIDTMRIRPELRKPLDEGRLLFLSPFSPKDNRISSQRADIRNRFVASLADVVFIAYAARGGKIEDVYSAIRGGQRPLLILDDDNNRHLYGYAASPVNHSSIVRECIGVGEA